MSALVPRDTIEDIVAKRNKALSLYAKAFDTWEGAAAAMKAATDASKIAAPGSRFNYHLSGDSREMFTVLNTPKRDAFTIHMRRITDTDCWSHVLSLTNLERLMDREAKDQLHRQLIDEPPEITADNIHATLEQFMLDADTIWKRGIANCFAALDRRFKSHDGWKIGSRVILERAFDDSGQWSYYGHKRDSLVDIERTFLVLDGRPRDAMYGGISEAIDRERRRIYQPHQSEHEGEFFKIRIFKNGNAHLWFTRDDLVDRVNQLLGEYYDAPIPHEREADKDDGMAPKTSLAKNYGWYPTPPDAADALIAVLPLYRRDEAPLTVLEPSAGSGNLARLCLEKGAIVDCVEIHAERARDLRVDNRYRKVTTCDFLTLKPDPANLYDLVVMNPPFDRERDIDHVWHALKFLKLDGCLVAIMSAGTEFRETKKATTFRELIAKLNGIWRDMPPGSFASVGTYCNTIILKVYRDGRGSWW